MTLPHEQSRMIRPRVGLCVGLLLVLGLVAVWRRRVAHRGAGDACAA